MRERGAFVVSVRISRRDVVGVENAGGVEERRSTPTRESRRGPPCVPARGPAPPAPSNRATGPPCGDGAYEWLDSEPRTIPGKEHRPSYGSDGDYWSKPNRETIFEGVYALMHEANPRKYPALL